MIGLASANAVAHEAVLRSQKHPISIINAIAYVTRQSVLIRAEVLAEDMTLFHGIEPDEEEVFVGPLNRSGCRW